MASEQAREFGQDVVEVPAVGYAQEIVGDREIENEQVPAWLDHATHFAQRGRVVGHVAKSEGDSDAVEARIIEGQTQGIGNHRAADAAARGMHEHFGAEVGGHDLAVRAVVLDFQSQIAGARCDIEQIFCTP